MDSEDLELIDILQNLDDKVTIDDDSVIATPHDKIDEDLDDAEYSKVFNDETIVLENKWYVPKANSKGVIFSDCILIYFF